VSVWELFWPLLEGGRVVLALPGQQKDPLALNELLTRERIAFAHFVPSMLSTFMQIAGFEDIPALRAVVCSGEALDASLCERFFAQAHGTKLYNMYGPTEASVDVSSWECAAGETTVPIGRPIDGIRLPVLGTHLGSVPLGASGELHIGGVGLARGYLSNPIATAAAFVPDAMAEEPGTRLYRSGDLARYREDGAIEFLGRRDNQIKLRGYRIELGEIEHALLTSPGVTDGVVIHKHGGASDSVLLAYVTGEVVPHDLRRHLTTVLPSYMVPGHIAVLDSFPRLSSGKVDRSLLAQRTSEPSRQASAPFIARTETEEALSTLWKHHLRADSIDAGLDFFSAGGHSLAAVALLSDINGEFRIRMPLQVLLESGSFSDLASRIDGLRCLQSPGAARATELRPLEVEGSL